MSNSEQVNAAGVGRDVIEYDFVTVGAGPAVLVFAIQLTQLNRSLAVGTMGVDE